MFRDIYSPLFWIGFIFIIWALFDLRRGVSSFKGKICPVGEDGLGFVLGVAVRIVIGFTALIDLSRY